MNQPQGHQGASGWSPRRTGYRRLTAGWQHTGRPADLREHYDRYGPLPAARQQSPRALVDAIATARLTGRGGAGFPTATKMRAVTGRRGPAVVVANGVESEPASQKDQALLARAPHLVLDGALLAARAVGASVVHVCLDRTRDRQADGVLRAITERQRAGLGDVAMVAHGLPPRYVASEETSLIRWLNGGDARPTTVPPRPFEQGVGRRPTLVDNVETLAHVALIARYGPDWFCQAGHPDTPGTMLITVGGAVGYPGVYEIEAGTRVGDVLAMCDGNNEDGALLVGGYFGTWHPARALAHLPLSAPGLRAAGASPGAGVIFALPAGGCGLTETARILGFLAGQAAQQCGPCMFGLPAVADDFSRLADGRPDGGVLERLDRRLGAITGRGACRHPDGAVRMAASALAAFAPDARAHAAGRPCLGAYQRGSQGARPPIPQPTATTAPRAEDEWR
jgi:NADH:ubiquinone oxidoreductase subunit F (NADH-binding)